MKKAHAKNTSFDIAVGCNIKFFRTSKGLTRSQLADKIGMSHQQLSKYEHGANSLRLSMAITLANTLGVSLYDIASNTNTVSMHVDAITDKQCRKSLKHMQTFMQLNNPQRDAVHHTAVAFLSLKQEA